MYAIVFMYMYARVFMYAYLLFFTHEQFSFYLFFTQLPQSLVFHIQRCQWLNDGTACKRQDFVSFPEILDMSNYVYHKVAAKESKKGVLGGGQQFLFG